MVPTTLAEALAEALAQGSAPQFEVDIDALLEKLTLVEQISLLTGDDDFTTLPIERLGIPALKFADYPNDHRAWHGTPLFESTTARFPSSISLAATFNPEISNRIGQALGQELRSQGASVFLGPLVDLHRDSSPRRNFGGFSEDPLLSGILATEFVKGLRSERVGATLKFFPKDENMAKTLSFLKHVDEQTLREKYLRVFEIVVKKSGPWCIHGRGVHEDASKKSHQQILMDEWNFDGLLVSDAASGEAKTFVGSINGSEGFDLEIASWRSPCRSNDDLMKATEDGLVTAKAIAARARAVLQLLNRTGKLTEQFYAISDATEVPPENREAIREVEAESIVLLKNETNILPLDRTKLKKVALLGPLVKHSTVPDQDGNKISPFDAFKERLGDVVEISYSKGTHARPASEKELQQAILFEAVALAKEADFAIVFCGNTKTEWLEPSDTPQHELISKIAKANPNTIVVSSIQGAFDAPWVPNIAAFIQTWQTSQNSANLIVDILLGDVCPSGKLPICWPGEFWYRFPESSLDHPSNKTLFPFGHGLSYTTFTISSPRLFGRIEPTQNDGITISVSVKNTGSVAGAETVQAYVSSLDTATTRPLKQKLVAFSKVFLEPGEGRLVTLNFERDSVAVWDVENGRWKVEGGTYEVLLGSSSREEDLGVRLEMVVKEAFGFPA